MSKTLGQRLEDLNIEVGNAMPIIDWRHYRIQAAIAAMQTVDDHVSTVEELASRCVRYADALISELKKGGEV